MKIYKVAIFGYLTLVSLLYSCGNTAEKEDPDTIETAGLSSADAVLQPFTDTAEIAGFYQGTFPCIDCEGLEQSLLLKHNGSYKQAFSNIDSNKIKSHSTGSWMVEAGKVVLIENNENRLIFDFVNDDLMAVNIDGIEIKDPSKYLLDKKPFGGDNQNREAEINKGVLFKAHGNEPFWSLSIKNGTVLFKLMDWKNELKADYVQIEKINDSTIYHLKSDGKEWSVAIIDQFCNDGMSDLTYEYGVIINYDGEQYQGVGIDYQTR